MSLKALHIHLHTVHVSILVIGSDSLAGLGALVRNSEADLNVGFENLYTSSLSGSVPFPCVVLLCESTKMKQYCPQIKQA